ncbi:MAG: 16S rRNA (cytosine(1402)-N(4))-methyltransferase, partial [Bacteroidota bacterium]
VVKNFFRQGSFDETPDNPLMSIAKEEVFKIITKKPVTASDEELKRNNRSRSAKLRIAERV